MTNATTTDRADYGDAAALTELLGDGPRVKIIAVLLKEGRDINATQIAENGGMSRSTVYRHIDPLITLGVIEKTREVGGGPLYQINRESDVAAKLAELEWTFISDHVDKDEEEDFEIPEAPPT